MNRQIALELAQLRCFSDRRPYDGWTSKRILVPAARLIVPVSEKIRNSPAILRRYVRDIATAKRATRDLTPWRDATRQCRDRPANNSREGRIGEREAFQGDLSGDRRRDPKISSGECVGSELVH
jgi:hypothetical protein